MWALDPWCRCPKGLAPGADRVANACPRAWRPPPASPPPNTLPLPHPPRGPTRAKRTAARSLVRASARALHMKERLLGSKPPITSQILRLAGLHMWYSSAKADRELNWRAGRVDAGIAAAWHEINATDSR